MNNAKRVLQTATFSVLLAACGAKNNQGAHEARTVLDRDGIRIGRMVTSAKDPEDSRLVTDKEVAVNVDLTTGQRKPFQAVWSNGEAALGGMFYEGQDCTGERLFFDTDFLRNELFMLPDDSTIYRLVKTEVKFNGSIYFPFYGCSSLNGKRGSTEMYAVEAVDPSEIPDFTEKAPLTVIEVEPTKPDNVEFPPST